MATGEEIYGRHFEPIKEGKASSGERKEHVKFSEHQDSPAKDHIEIAGIRWKELMGKKVLCVGGAIGGNFETIARSKGVNLFTVNPDRPFKKPGTMHSGTLGYSQELPFEDNTFDYVLALASIPAYLPPYSYDYESSFKEIYRTLKPRGKAIFFPFYEHLLDDPIFDKILSDLKVRKAHIDMVYLKSEKNIIPNNPERSVKIYRMIITKHELPK